MDVLAQVMLFIHSASCILFGWAIATRTHARVLKKVGVTLYVSGVRINIFLYLVCALMIISGGYITTL